MIPFLNAVSAGATPYTGTDGECVVLFCEAEELCNTSPAIKSNGGFIFVPEDDLDNEPLVGVSLDQRRKKKRVILKVLWPHCRRSTLSSTSSTLARTIVNDHSQVSE